LTATARPTSLPPTGWFKQIDADKDQWEWHPDFHLGDTGFPIIGYDVLNNGKTDIIYGQGHSYGLYWLEQTGTPRAARQWVKHTIDESFSQSHALNGGPGRRRRLELITGKRYRGHSGHDAGSYDPLVVYYYKINRKTGEFTRYPISVNGTAAWERRLSPRTWMETAISISPPPEKPACTSLRT
jgi:hypothetical protein